MAGKRRTKKIPTEVLLSPGGVILICYAFLMEIIDFLPLPSVIDQLIELPLEIVFIVLLITITKVPLKSLILPFLIERVPIINALPTWLIRIFM